MCREYTVPGDRIAARAVIGHLDFGCRLAGVDSIMQRDLGQAVRVGNPRGDRGLFALGRKDRRVVYAADDRAGVSDERGVWFSGRAQIVRHRQGAKRLEATAARAHEQLGMPAEPSRLALDPHFRCVASGQRHPDGITLGVAAVDGLDVERPAIVRAEILNDGRRLVCAGDLQFA